MKIVAVLLAAIISCPAACQQGPTRSAVTNADTGYVYRTRSPGGTGKYYFGREIAQVMDASGSDWLERASRPQEENTDLIVESMHLRPAMTVADIGAGTGYYTFRMAQRLSKGRVYAVEIQDELIKMLNKKKEETQVNNVEVIKGDAKSARLPARSIDLVIMVDVYHELLWPRELMRSINRSLKPDGRMLLVEYRGEDPSVPIKPLHKTTVAQLEKEMKSIGFELDRRVNTLPIQHFLLFKKQ